MSKRDTRFSMPVPKDWVLLPSSMWHLTERIGLGRSAKRSKDHHWYISPQTFKELTLLQTITAEKLNLDDLVDSSNDADGLHTHKLQNMKIWSHKIKATNKTIKAR